MLIPKHQSTSTGPNKSHPKPSGTAQTLPGGVCLKTARRRKTPQTDAKRLFLRNAYVLLHVSYVNVPTKSMSYSKIQQKYKIQTAKMHKTVNLSNLRRKTPQDVAKCLATV